MKQADFPEFTALLDSVAALLGKPTPGTQQTAMFFRVLNRYPIEAVRQALDAHLRDPQRGRFFPVPADVIAKLEELEGPGRPTSDEAWAIAIKARDESETVVWTEDMAQAWGICKPVMDTGDEVGARMAFKAAYDRITGDAKREGLPVRWLVSEGFDKDKRVAAAQRAESVGLLLPHEAKAALQALEFHGQDAVGPMPPEIKERLNELRDSFVHKPSEQSLAELERLRTERLKREQADKVLKYHAEQEHTNG